MNPNNKLKTLDALYFITIVIIIFSMTMLCDLIRHPQTHVAISISAYKEHKRLLEKTESILNSNFWPII